MSGLPLQVIRARVVLVWRAVRDGSRSLALRADGPGGCRFEISVVHGGGWIVACFGKRGGMLDAVALYSPERAREARAWANRYAARIARHRAAFRTPRRSTLPAAKLAAVRKAVADRRRRRREAGLCESCPRKSGRFLRCVECRRARSAQRRKPRAQ